MFYEMGWDRDEKAEVGREKIFAAAVRNNVTTFAPCSSAWKRVRRERPDLDLQNPPDRTHPGTLGCYLNLCCFYAALTGTAPERVPRNLRVWRHLSDDEKKALNQKVKPVEFDEYDRTLSGWMKRLVVGAEEATVPGDVAAYLERVAWEEYQAFQSRLKTGEDLGGLVPDRQLSTTGRQPVIRPTKSWPILGERCPGPRRT